MYYGTKKPELTACITEIQVKRIFKSRPPRISIPCGVFANFLWGIGCVPRVVLRKGPINEAKVKEEKVKEDEEEVLGFELSTLGL